MNLEGRSILIYVDGGWTISGLVEKFDKDKIILSVDSKSDLYVIFRDKISIVKLIEEDKEELGVVSRMTSKREKEGFPENSMTYSENNFSLPRDMIKKDMRDKLEDDDLSIIFPNSNDGKISFRRNDE